LPLQGASIAKKRAHPASPFRQEDSANGREKTAEESRMTWLGQESAILTT